MKERTVRRVVGNFVSNLFGKKPVERVAKIQNVKSEKKPDSLVDVISKMFRTPKVTRGSFGGKRSSKLSRKLSRTQQDYANKKMRQFAYQGLSKGRRELRIKKDRYLQICLYGKAI